MTRTVRYALFAVIFVTIEFLLFSFVDRPVSTWVGEMDSTHKDIINIFRAHTDLGKSKWYLWPAAFALLVCAIACRTGTRPQLAKAGHKLLFFFISIALSGVVTDIIKPILGRARPVEIERQQLYGFYPFTFHASMNSMPSGHATTAAALAMTLCFLYPRYRMLWITFGFALAVSRVMVNAHYVSDVVAGMAVGIVTTRCLHNLWQQEGMFPRTRGIFPIDKKPPIS